jgi:hypothetical protein
MPDYDKLLQDLQKLLESWENIEGAYLNDFGNGVGSCYRELEAIVKDYLP